MIYLTSEEAQKSIKERLKRLETMHKAEANKNPGQIEGINEAWAFASTVLHLYQDRNKAEEIFRTKNMFEVFDTPYFRAKAVYDEAMKAYSDKVIDKMAKKNIDALEALGYKVTVEKIETD